MSRRRLDQALVLLPAVLAFGLLVFRLARDVHEKPLVEDEAVAGLIGARPLGELLATVVWDRGGAPLHFLLVHVVLAFDSSADALRWLSVASHSARRSLASSSGRRLGGLIAGAAAGVAGATSGTADDLRQRRADVRAASHSPAGSRPSSSFGRSSGGRESAAFTAALAAWLLPAVHPYGGVAVAVEAAIALYLWRGRPLRPALPALAVVVAMLPFAFFDLRLARRFDVGGSGESLAGPGETWHQLELVIRGSAGGSGLALVLFLALAVVGLATLARERPAVAAAHGALAARAAAALPDRAEPLLARPLAAASDLRAAAVGGCGRRGGGPSARPHPSARSGSCARAARGLGRVRVDGRARSA